MSRSLKKGPFINPRLLEKIAAAKAVGKKAPIKTWARDSVISPAMVGLTFAVHNGKDFIDVFVEENMVGHRLGEFSPTRKFVRHGGKMAKDEELKAAEAAAAPAAAPTKGAPGAAAPAKK